MLDESTEFVDRIHRLMESGMALYDNDNDNDDDNDNVIAMEQVD